MNPHLKRLKATIDFKGVVNNTKVKNISKKIIRLTEEAQEGIQ